jgi:hypothetical protein
VARREGERTPYSAGIRKLWPDRRPEDLFIMDETVFRRIVWQGGGGYLAVHDLPGRRWVFFGPWELTLGHRRRYNRWVEKTAGRALLKGKILLDLSTAPVTKPSFDVAAVGEVVDHSRAGRDQLAGIQIDKDPLPEVGTPHRLST